MTDYYTAKFYQDISAGSKRSAEIVLPLVLSVVKPRSVVDIGCGSGAWLSAAKKNNVSEVLGLDGDYAKNNFNPDEFRSIDINNGFLLDKKYDLALCLEVGEHILTRKSSLLVDSLTKAADIILFSAGIPGQGGNHHINEQWPVFWQRLFQDRDFVCIDCIRPEIYNNPEVEWWYRQNIFLYVNRRVMPQFPCWEDQLNRANDILLVHTSLLKKRYGLVRSFLDLFRRPIAAIINRMRIS